MKIVNVFSFYFSGIRLTNRNFLQSIRFNLLLVSATVLISYLGAIAAIKITYSRKLQEVIATLISFPVLAYLSAGTLYYYLSYFRGITVRLNKVYRGYRWLPSFMKYSFLLILMYQLIGMPLLRFREYELEAQIRIFAGAIFFFWVVTRCFFLPLVVVDFREKNFEWCVFESMKLSRGYTLSIVIFLLVAIIAFAFGALIAGAGVLYSMAVIILSYIKFYSVVKTNESSES